MAFCYNYYIKPEKADPLAFIQQTVMLQGIKNEWHITMIQSMTAFARGQTETEIGEFIFEIRSVNQRYLDLYFRLPESLRFLEMHFRQALANYIKRGKIEVTLNYVPLISEQGLKINENNLLKIANAVDAMQHTILNLAPINSLELMKWPGVLESQQADENKIKDCALSAFENTLQKLVVGRQQEGQALQAIILARVDECQKEINKLSDISKEIENKVTQRIQEKSKALAVEIDSNRLEQEVVFLLQKADVAEEIDRLHTHLHEVKQIFKKGGVVGRRLDFLMQELNREANTLGSKAVMIETTNVSLELKVLIEQMREQVQNIE